MIMHKLIKKWEYILYNYILLNKYLQISFADITKHINDLIFTYNEYKIYWWSKINDDIIIKYINSNYWKFVSFLIKIVTAVKNIKKNEIKLKKMRNEYLIAFQKLNNRVMLKLVTMMKEVMKINKKNSDDN